jgi:glycosyltransferase involved in cell wall biosynthesis
MRVGFISHSADRYGAEKVLLDLLDGLSAHGVDCFVLLPHSGPLVEELRQRQLPYTIIPYSWWVTKHWGVRAPWWQRWLRTLSNGGLSLLVVYRLWRWRIDIVYTNTGVVPVGAFAARLLGKPHIWHLHEMLGDAYGWFFDLNATRSLRLIAALSDVIVSTSLAVQSIIAPYTTSTQLVVLHPASSVPEEEACDQNTSPQTPCAHGFHALIVGTFSPQKGQMDALQALAVLSREGCEIFLTLVGDSDPADKRRLHDYIQTQDLFSRVRFTGYVADPVPLMRSSDVLLVCSRFEGFGRVIVEAMRLGKPVIVARGGGSEELMQDGWNGFLYTPGDISALAKSLRTLLHDPARAHVMGQNGRRSLSGKYTRDAMVNQALAFFERRLLKVEEPRRSSSHG